MHMYKHPRTVIYLHKNTYIQTYIHVNIHTYLYTCIHTYIHISISIILTYTNYMHTMIHTYIHSCIKIYIHTQRCTEKYNHTQIYIYALKNIISLHTQKHTYTYIHAYIHTGVGCLQIQTHTHIYYNTCTHLFQLSFQRSIHTTSMHRSEAVGMKLLLQRSVLTCGASNLRPEQSLMKYCERKCEVSPDTLQAFFVALLLQVAERVGSVSPITCSLCLRTLLSLLEFLTFRLPNKARNEKVKKAFNKREIEQSQDLCVCAKRS